MRAALFAAETWKPALETFGGVTNLTVLLYDEEAHSVSSPLPASPLFDIFQEFSYGAELFRGCATATIAQRSTRAPVVIADSYGLAVVGTSLVLDGAIVGAAVAGFTLVDFPAASAMERLARQAGVRFSRLWDVARRQQPVPERRLVTHGELLQVLGDTILRENARTRQYEELNARLEIAGEAREEFLAVLSHELRTPLTPILGWTRILRQAPDPMKTAQAADVIERNALLLARLVDDLLELNRANRGKLMLDPAVHCLNTVIGSALEAIHELAGKKRLVIDFANPSERLCIQADPDRLQQILRNVLTNAVKFTPAGGAITVTLSRDGDWCQVQVRDTGEGIAPHFLPYLFEIFRQQEDGTRRKHAGLGIGLALVKRLTEAHGGTVHISSEGVSRGTTVTLRFPLVPEAHEETEPMLVDAASFAGLHVLVVEDMEDSREATRVMLEGLGANVEVAGGGAEALGVISEEPFDVVLCDLRMPLMDGYEFLNELHLNADHPHPPVVAISGLASSADHQRTAAAGFEGHIDKPFDQAALLRAVGAVMSRRRA